MKYKDKIGIVAVSGLMFGMISCSDFSDYNTAPENFSSMEGKTLWQNITENEGLSDFAAIIQKAGFDKDLNNPNFYTVFAPKNGTFNADSVLALDKDVILKEFVKQHVVDYNYQVNSALTDSKILSINAKSHVFNQKGYGDARFCGWNNLPSSNGTMHIMNGNEGFYNNIYEYISKIEGCDNFRDYVKQYDEEYIDKSNSILGPIVNGEQTYQYVEYLHRNKVVNDLIGAKLENEDSTYTVLFPNDEAWQKSYERIKKDFNYIDRLTYMNFDGISFPSTVGASIKATEGKLDLVITAKEYLADSLVKYNMVHNLAFSHGYPINETLLSEESNVETDSVYTTSRIKVVSAKDIKEHTVERLKMSNGYVRVVDSIPFQPWGTFERVVTAGGVGRVLKGGSQLSSIDKTELFNRDTLFQYVPNFVYDRIMGKYADEKSFKFYTTTGVTGSNAPELDFRLCSYDESESGDFKKISGTVLSTKYHIYVVTVPDQILDDGITRVTNHKPYYLRFFLNYTDENNTQIKKELSLASDADPSLGVTTVKEGTGSKAVTSIVTKGGYVNVIDLGEVEFPVCYYGLEAYPNIMMCHTQTYNTAAKRNKYEQQMRVAGVFLFPVEADTYFKNHVDENTGEMGYTLHKVVAE